MKFDDIKLLRVDIRDYLLDFIWLIVSLLLTSLISYYSYQIWKSVDILKQYVNSGYVPFSSGVIRVVLFISIFFILRKFISRWFWMIFFTTPYKFSKGDLLKRWIFHGGVNEEDGMFIIKSSSNGCLLKNRNWKNLEMSFDLILDPPHNTIINTEPNALGILFGADDLENYYMLQIRNMNHAMSVVPHIRLNGIFEIINPPIDTKFIIDKPLNIKFNLRSRMVKLYVDEKEIFDWLLPTHFLGTHYSHGYDTQSVREIGRNTNVPRIHGNGNGKIGFRSSIGEVARIKNLIIKRI